MFLFNILKYFLGVALKPYPLLPKKRCASPALSLLAPLVSGKGLRPAVPPIVGHSIYIVFLELST